MTELILASGSPRRSAILTELNIPFRVLITGADESVPADYTPAEAAMEASRRKAAAAVKEAGAGAIVIAADTVVASGGMILGKPADEQGAFDMLRMLSGTSHSVITGVSIAKGDGIVTDYEETKVNMRALSDEEIWTYVKKFAPMDKAGAYGIQEAAGFFVSGIEGDYSNVVGLPVYKLGQMLKDSFGMGFEELYREA